jgi:DNA-binding MarR family transcriptional regulator
MVVKLLAYPRAVPARPAELARLLRDAWAAVEATMAAELAERGAPGLRPAHLPVLRRLGPDGARVTDIAREIGVTRQAVAQTVGSLLEDGWVEVVPDPEDGRARLLRYTAWGRERYVEALRVYDELEAAFEARVGAQRAAALRDGLRELRAVADERRPGQP